MKNLLQVLEQTDKKSITPARTHELLTKTDFTKIEYESYLEGHSTEAYAKIRISDQPFQVFLSIWPPQFLLPIHQHKNFWGYVIPLKGLVSETIYGYAARKRKVYLHPTKTFKPGEIIYEPYNVIHKLQNTSPLEPTIALHIYYPPFYDYNGTLLFDAQNRKLAVLNEKATRLAWDLPSDHYSRIEENAYDVEKLW